jgi:hypothetical protein
MDTNYSGDSAVRTADGKVFFIPREVSAELAKIRQNLAVAPPPNDGIDNIKDKGVPEILTEMMRLSFTSAFTQPVRNQCLLELLKKMPFLTGAGYFGNIQLKSRDVWDALEWLRVPLEDGAASYVRGYYNQMINAVS